MDNQITKESENTETLNEKKLKFLSYINTYTKAARHIASNLATLDYLTSEDEFVKNDVKKIFAIAPSFMKATIDNSWAQCVIKFNCFFSSDYYNLKNFTNYVSGNWDKIFKNNFFDFRGELIPISIKKDDVFTAIKEAEQIQKEQDKIIQKIKIFRKYFFAHFSDISSIRERIEISVDELKVLLDAIENIVNLFEKLYFDYITKFAALNSGDIKVIVNYVNEHKFSKLPYERGIYGK